MANAFRSVKLPKSFVAINLSEKVPDAFGARKMGESDGGSLPGNGNGNGNGNENVEEEKMEVGDGGLLVDKLAGEQE